MELSYLIYLIVSVVMTIWVARTLSKNGEVFLVKCFGQDEVLAKSTNHLLVVGFYLINVGLIAIRLDGWHIAPGDGLIPYVGSKIGVSVLSLGAMHFFNMVMIAKFGRTITGWVRVNELREPEKFSAPA
ncbi:hypothetical protein H8L32_12555 [Undibacterium sp. CY18W]|uniref:Integral membrane protein n=2 Tax=Undibacterium hunanense TaxID=2762292 RepID=A0ABR6ZRR8_9BURK|nr:hypothetical protein [Undibacterium hunanense]